MITDRHLFTLSTSVFPIVLKVFNNNFLCLVVVCIVVEIVGNQSISWVCNRFSNLDAKPFLLAKVLGGSGAFPWSIVVGRQG